MNPNQIVERLEYLTDSAKQEHHAGHYERVLHLTREIRLDAAHLITLHKELSETDRLRVENSVFTAYKLQYFCFKSLAVKWRLTVVGRYYYSLRAEATLRAANHRFRREIGNKDRRTPDGWRELEKIIGLRRL